MLTPPVAVREDNGIDGAFKETKTLGKEFGKITVRGWALPWACPVLGRLIRMRVSGDAPCGPEHPAPGL